MDVLNLVAQDIYFCLSDGPNERKVKMIKHQLRAFSTFFKQLVQNISIKFNKIKLYKPALVDIMSAILSQFTRRSHRPWLISTASVRNRRTQPGLSDLRSVCHHRRINGWMF